MPRIPLNSFNPTLTFGVEIEAHGVPSATVAAALSAAGIATVDAGYTHRQMNSWKVVPDGSISATNAFEVVSPKLIGADGFQQVRTVCAVLNRLGAKVNKDCGLHVHHEASDFQVHQWKNIAILYARIEKRIDAMMPETRRGNENRWCQSIVSKMTGYCYAGKTGYQTISQANTYDEVRAFFNWGNPNKDTTETRQSYRYHKLNFNAWENYKTVEFRHHSGTCDGEKIVGWVIFTQLMMNRIRQTRNTLKWDGEHEFDALKDLAVQMTVADDTTKYGILYMRDRIAHFRKNKETAGV